jgi:hypothetical protein
MTRCIISNKLGAGLNWSSQDVRQRICEEATSVRDFRTRTRQFRDATHCIIILLFKLTPTQQFNTIAAHSIKPDRQTRCSLQTVAENSHSTSPRSPSGRQTDETERHEEETEQRTRRQNSTRGDRTAHEETEQHTIAVDSLQPDHKVGCGQFAFNTFYALHALHARYALLLYALQKILHDFLHLLTVSRDLCAKLFEASNMRKNSCAFQAN